MAAFKKEVAPHPKEADAHQDTQSEVRKLSNDLLKAFFRSDQLLLPCKELAAKLVKIADAHAQVARRAARSQVVDVISPSIGNGDNMRRVHVLDLNALSTQGLVKNPSPALLNSHQKKS